MSHSENSTTTVLIRARIKDFEIPPVHDGLIVGRRSAIGSVALRKALDLLSTAHFEHIEVDDDVISDILVRTRIIRRVSRQKLIDFILGNIKPIMIPEDIIHLDLDVESVIEQKSV